MSLAPTASRLWLIRHAKVQAPSGICYGQLDLPAQPDATQQSALVLAQTLPKHLHVWCSPLQRCDQLTQALSALRPDLTFETDLRLRELDFGAWEGLLWDDIARSEIDAWSTQLATYAPGGGETLEHMLARVRSALKDTFSHRNPQRVGAWLSHAGVARCVQWLLSSSASTQPCATHWPVDAPAPGAWMVVDVSEDARERLFQTTPSHRWGALP